GRGGPAARARGAPRARRSGTGRSLRVSRSLPLRLARVPPRPADRARRAHPPGGALRGSRSARHLRRLPRCAGGLRRAAAGLARVAERASRGRGRADGVHPGVVAFRRADRRGARRRRRQPWHLGRHRRVSPHAGADDRQHPRGAPARRGRVRPVLVRQSYGPEAAGTRLPFHREPRRVRRRAFDDGKLSPLVEEVARIIERAISSRAFPAATIEVGRRASVLWRAPCGTLTYEADAPAVTDDTVFDLASLTKVIATATTAMRAVDAGRLSLDARVADFLSGWRGADRDAVTIADLLEHASGLTAYLPFFRDHQGRAEFERAICTLP